VAFNAPSLAKFGPTVRPEGMIIYDSSVINAQPDMLPAGVRLVPVPFTNVANDLGAVLVKNVVALGALQGATNVFPEETFLTAIRSTLRQKCAMIPLNEEAFKLGAKLASEQAHR
jgi:Pyruvate/2-oxoacid:ferredoxin oxidoreductase gamma subunit